LFASSNVPKSKSQALIVLFVLIGIAIPNQSKASFVSVYTNRGTRNNYFGWGIIDINKALALT